MASRTFKVLLAALGATLLAGAAAAQDTIKIGVTQPLTGAFAASGNYVAQGAKIAEDEINTAGGVLGRRSSSSSRTTSPTRRKRSPPSRS